MFGFDYRDDSLSWVEKPAIGQLRLPRLSFPEPGELVGNRWWSFGLAEQRDGYGLASYGTIVANVTSGLVQVDPNSRRGLNFGFAGAPLWSPEHDAVVGIIAGIREEGDGIALTLHHVDRQLSGERLWQLADPVRGTGLGAHETQTLVTALADLAPQTGTARRMLSGIGYPEERLPSFTAFATPALFWAAVVAELENGIIQDGVPRLLRVALQFYPYNPSIQQLQELV